MSVYSKSSIPSLKSFPKLLPLILLLLFILFSFSFAQPSKKLSTDQRQDSTLKALKRQIQVQDSLRAIKDNELQVAFKTNEKWSKLAQKATDNEEKTISWWLSFVGIVLTFMCAFVALVGIGVPIFLYKENRNMKEDIKKLDNELVEMLKKAEAYLGDIKKIKSEAVKHVEDLKSGDKPTPEQERSLEEIEKDPDAPEEERWRARALLAEQDGNWEKAVDCWKTVLQLNPNNDQALFGLTYSIPRTFEGKEP
jgi:cytochrome c-type biogenesis protein CcmH/NrfG